VNAETGDCVITCDRARIDPIAVHAELRTQYWCKGIPLEIVKRSMEHSMCFAAMERASGKLVAFARVISDHATFAYLCDVFVIHEFRGRALSVALIRAIVDHPDLQGLRRWCLLTRDAHALYSKFGFEPMPDPGRYMERVMPRAYESPT
jgi:N-acetylglutamate synthase-like GNAT family acetyltransferase